ncbi:MAG: hypothetical protein DRR08_10425 [Candidatus Parabeggiatoa sp. nov. 2]|nr:MAG: hypothetical protein DRR08_10425 [Gammaproteobacteria bacterium]HEC83650.1 hypothetical protein [Thioploca sp.]
MYPLQWRNHSPIIRQFPYRLPPNGVVPPFGGDNLVAVLCTRVAQVAENKRTLSPRTDTNHIRATWATLSSGTKSVF